MHKMSRFHVHRSVMYVMWACVLVYLLIYIAVINPLYSQQALGSVLILCVYSSDMLFSTKDPSVI